MLVPSHERGQKSDNALINLLTSQFGKPNLLLLIQVQKCTFCEYQSYARFSEIRVVGGCSKISNVKPHRVTHYFKVLERRSMVFF